MQRYYFDFHDGAEIQTDAEGSLLPNMQAARDEATETLLSIAREALTSHGEARQMSILVRSDAGDRLLTITLSYWEEPPDWAR